MKTIRLSEKYAHRIKEAVKAYRLHAVTQEKILPQRQDKEAIEDVLRAEVEMAIAQAIDQQLFPELVKIGGEKAELKGDILRAESEYMPVLAELTTENTKINLENLREIIIESVLEVMYDPQNITISPSQEVLKRDPSYFRPIDPEQKKLAKYLKDRIKILSSPISKAILELIASMPKNAGISASEIARALGVSLGVFEIAFDEIKWRLPELFYRRGKYELSIFYLSDPIYFFKKNEY